MANETPQQKEERVEEEGVEEEGVEEALHNTPRKALGDGGQLAAVQGSAGGSKEEESLPRGNEREELQRDPQVNQVASNGKLTQHPTALSPDRPKNHPLDQESYFLSGDDAPLNESGPPTGYFPCYRTCAELPPHQPSGNGVPPWGEAETSPGSARDAGTRGGRGLPEEAGRGGERGKGPTTHFKDAQGEPTGGRPRGSSPEKKDGKDKSGQERPPKPPRPGSSPSQPNVNMGVSEEAPGSGSRKGQLPVPLCGRRSPQKKHRQSCRTEDEEPGKEKGLRLVCSDPRLLLGSLEEKRGPRPTSRDRMETSGENREVVAEVEAGRGEGERGESRPPPPPLQSCPSAPPAGSPSEVPPSPPHRSVWSVLSRVRNIFRTSPPTQEQPTTSAGVETGHRKSAHGLRAWVARHRGHVHPLPC